MKNVLVTGGAGYIGSHIVELLVKEKYNVFIVDNLVTGYRLLINKKAKFFKISILNSNKIKKIIINNKIDSIIHLAASLSIGIGEKHPKQYFKNNVLGTKSLMQACKNTNVKNFIFSSTAAVYKDGFGNFTEKSKINPKSIYGKTKRKAEIIIIQISKKYNLNFGILRYFNVCGASPSGKIGLITNGDHLFKNFSMEIVKKNPVLKIYGNNYKTPDKTPIRDYIHVSDLATIHLKVLKKISSVNKSIILNCGYGLGTSVLEVLNSFKKYSKKKIKVVIKDRRIGDMEKIVASNKKLLHFINWKPKYKNLDKIIKSCLKWEKKQKGLVIK